ncbi:MAG: SDR family oxidoreductase [Planctomycetota bacterium]
MSNKNYVVVGGSYGIGLEIVRRLDASQNQVTVLSRTAGELTQTGAKHFEFDATSGEVSSEWLPEQIHGLAYCPGSINLGSIRSIKPETMQADYLLNVIGAVRCLQACLPAMKKSGGASMVMFSTVAVGQGLPMHGSVAAAKGAIEGMTRSFAAELAPTVRVNCVAPSITDTPLAEKLLSSDQKKAAMGERHPLKRIGSVDDIAAIAEFLLSDQSSWVTGQVIHADGGMSTLRV